MKQRNGITRVELTISSIAFGLLLAWSAGYINIDRPLISVCAAVAVCGLCYLIFWLTVKAYRRFFHG
ncbi:hypothetical protein [Corynebacterium pygosceleis]|uniref:Uncharacterized protein n=1 Tax=Corynebacterium pygosceleis TaxID=2800406 RepID=A0A9Q4GJD5_9CORY|nr:hypothetical protein [Corynebacterium pygosceleis]MCK7637637.1 hypothetical protein [Corynebacterium pygosceleis]MCK7674828.1 hypothetical protein [Corynebacterium pygosceleis]MCL0119583.1 hypothetical protein [Corynebacterium pygosceleis]MCX7444824.1 hypothetical protein [Corynebacterium pygosceleis]MCX7468034.1 hypothetical protein [Corynebacterium pygosceleis]